MVITQMKNNELGKNIAARIGVNVRELRTQLNMTQAQLAAPEYSISYISAIERGKIRPSLKAITNLARRLDVPVTYLLEGHPERAGKARAVGFPLADAGDRQKEMNVALELEHARIFVQQGKFTDATALLAPLQSRTDKLTTVQVYHLFLIQGEVALRRGNAQEAAQQFRAAVDQATAMNETTALVQAKLRLGESYFALQNYLLAQEQHQSCAEMVKNGQMSDPFFAADVLFHLGKDSLAQGQSEEAQRSFEQALAFLERTSASLASTYLEVSQQYQQSGKQAGAYEYALRSRLTYDTLAQQQKTGLTRIELGKALQQQGREHEAEAVYKQALEENALDQQTLALILLSLAELVNRWDADQATIYAQNALALAQKEGSLLVEAQSFILLGQLAHHKRDFLQVDSFFAQAFALLTTIQAYEQLAGAYFRYSALLEERGEIEKSLSAVRTAFSYRNRA